MNRCALYLRNTEWALLDDVPLVDFEAFREDILAQVSTDARITAWFGLASGNDAIRLIAVLAHDASGQLAVLSTHVKNSYPSLTPQCPQVHLFERAFFEQWGIRPEGHPGLKPVRFSAASKAGHHAPCLDPYQITGDEVHEVAVGPVHAGIIEPGHFRFQCHGETVYNLEISLGYQHRGIEHALAGVPDKKTRHYIETASGDTTIGHMLAYVHMMESLTNTPAPPVAEMIRGIALELERMACHTGDLGALAGDVGYLPTSSFCGRLRGDFLNMTALLCGNRFGRGLLQPGGVNFDLDAERSLRLLERLEKTFQDVKQAVNMLWDSPSVMARFENTGILTEKMAMDLGLVGPACRASGIERDVRYNFPQGLYTTNHIPVSIYKTGDVFGRAYIRWLEIQRSYEFIKNVLTTPVTGPLSVPTGDLGGHRIAVSLVEAWRGEICHVAVTGPDGNFLTYKITDPSFHNWTGLSMALRNEAISDFPLCNKSFNLSYCGHDL